jgi:hypothetical protein
VQRRCRGSTVEGALGAMAGGFVGRKPNPFFYEVRSTAKCSILLILLKLPNIHPCETSGFNGDLCYTSISVTNPNRAGFD